jgi:hypothetical protein
MLALALAAVILGCICLYLEVADYGDQPFKLGLSAPGGPDRPAATAVARCPGPRAPCDLYWADCWKTPVHG